MYTHICTHTTQITRNLDKDTSDDNRAFNHSLSLSLTFPARIIQSRKRVGMKDYLRQLLVSEPVHGPRVYPGEENRGSRREDADAGRRGAGRNRPRPRRSTGG